MNSITPTSGSVTVVTETKTADKYWIKHMVVSAPSTTQKVGLYCNLVPFNSTTGEMLDNKAVIVRIEDVFALASTNTVVAGAMNKLFEAIDNVAKQRGLI
jgi:hypothetical protein